MGHQDNKMLFKKQFLGDILIDRGRLSEAQLEQALRVQKKEGGGYLGEILVRLGFLEEQDIVVALMLQYNIAYIAIDQYEIDKSILQLIPKEFTQQHRVIPLDRVGNIFSVVMVDPLDLAVKAELHRMTNYSIAPFIATKAQIEKALQRWYP